MIERVTVDGEEASAAYLDDDFNPVDKDKATLVKLIFDSGRTLYLYPQQGDDTEA